MPFIKTFLFIICFGLSFQIQLQIKEERNTTASDVLIEVDSSKAEQFFIEKNWDSTIVYTAKVLTIAKKQNVLDRFHYIRGFSFMKKRLYDEAENEYSHVSKDFSSYYRIIRNLGGIALEQNKYKEAICYFESLRDYPNYKLIKSSVLHDLGLSYFHLAKFKAAEKYLLESNTLQEKEQDTSLLIGSYTDIANLYYEQYKDDLAIPYFEKAYQLSKKIKSFKLKRKTSLNMAVVEENRKDLKKALVYRKEYEKWKDSLNDQSKVWAIAQIEKRHAVDQKQKHIKILKSENEIKVIQRNGFIFSSVILLLFLSAGIYFYDQKNKNNKIILAQKEELDGLNATKDKLFSIISHDLRSSVNVLQKGNTKLLKDIDKQNYTAVKKTVLKNSSIANSTYNLLENLLQWATIQTHKLYFAIESIDLYTVLQQLEYNYKPLFENKSLIFENKIPKAVFVLADLDSLKIIIRNLLDNAIKFSEENDTISIYTYAKNDKQYLVIEDTGIGMSQETKEALLKEGTHLNKKKDQKGIGTGLGIQLCKSMIKKNKGELLIESKEGIGTKMIITLPKSQQYG
ncbi:tetratricopeptide repeat-containing sensor histidine kinase [Aquimarina rhabdastrellae]